MKDNEFSDLINALFYEDIISKLRGDVAVIEEGRDPGNAWHSVISKDSVLKGLEIYAEQDGSAPHYIDAIADSDWGGIVDLIDGDNQDERTQLHVDELGASITDTAANIFKLPCSNSEWYVEDEHGYLEKYGEA